MTYGLFRMTSYALVLGIGYSLGGVLLSYLWDIPSGPTIVLLATLCFFLALGFSPKRRARVPA